MYRSMILRWQIVALLIDCGIVPVVGADIAKQAAAWTFAPGDSSWTDAQIHGDISRIIDISTIAGNVQTSQSLLSFSTHSRWTSQTWTPRPRSSFHLQRQNQGCPAVE